MNQAALAYLYNENAYLNLTNRCPTRCRFCVKRVWDHRFRGWDLRLGRREPSVQRAWEDLVTRLAARVPREIVFCGYGEPAYRLPAVLRLARRARLVFPAVRLRLNTIGLGSLIWGRDITRGLAQRLDAVNVSLNTADPDQWLKLHAPLPRFAQGGFRGVLEFIAGCVREGLNTTVTAVDLPGVRPGAVRALAVSLGAGFLLRPRLGGPPEA